MNRQGAKDAKKTRRENKKRRMKLVSEIVFSFFVSVLSFFPWRPWRLGGSLLNR
jgi:hypothetical protein